MFRTNGNLFCALPNLAHSIVQPVHNTVHRMFDGHKVPNILLVGILG